MYDRNVGKTAIITGCNRGVGAGIRDVLLLNGYNVHGLNRTPVKEGELDIENYGILGTYTEHTIETAENELRTVDLPDRVDLLVVNAGIRRFNTVEDMSIGDWEDSVTVNLTWAFKVVKALVGRVKAAKGDIVFIGSHSEKYCFEKGAAYCTTKGALRELAECLMMELRYDDVRVSYLSLGSIKNREHFGVIDESWKLTPADVGETVYSIVSLPKNILIPYMDVRPAKPLKSGLAGIDRLQCV